VGVRCPRNQGNPTAVGYGDEDEDEDDDEDG